MAVALGFQGFFECRLATDDDLFDEPRGTSAGWTFALPGEPDLDRIIRFDPERAVARWGGPRIGVTVRDVSVGGTANPAHPLIGARVSLHGEPVFEGRNGTVAPNGREPVFPFEIGVAQDGFACRRAMHDPATGRPALVASNGRTTRPDLLRQAGITDAAQYRRERLEAIITRIGLEADPQALAGLQKRRGFIEQAVAANSAALMWGPAAADLFVAYDYALRSPDGGIADPAGSVPPIDVRAAWRATFSCGAWDADTLSGYVSGKLSLPTIQEAPVG